MMQPVFALTVATTLLAGLLGSSGRSPDVVGERRCSCSAIPNATEARREVPHVFLGEIIATRDTLWPVHSDYVRGAVMTIRVVDRWKGTDADTVRLMSQGMCDFRFAVGTRAVVFAYGRPTALTTSLCLPTAREADAAETLRLLGPPQSTEGQPPLVHRREARIHKQLQSP